jgi:hypothetical protein
MKTDLTIRILNNTNFTEAYEEFLLEADMNRSKYVSILSAAVLLINSTNINVKRLGYRIIVIYCNRKKDYRPLYDIAINNGMAPVAQYIDEKLMKAEMKNAFTEFNAAYNTNFIVNNVFYTLEQKNLIDFYNSNIGANLSVVAPTSYGKTDLILNTIQNNSGKNICIITPTKALLLQTQARILSLFNHHKKIITHPEMYNKTEMNVIAVMTQERVLRLLREAPNLKFDYVIIDEAHGLLHDDERNTLLASVILIIEKRNPETIFKFLTPFLNDANNLKVRYANYSLKTYKVDEYIKTEKLYIAELRKSHSNELTLYDQFLNKYFKIKELCGYSEWQFVREYAGEKNIVYFNKPKDIENFLQSIISNMKLLQNKRIDQACKYIAEYVHPKYRMIDALKRGVIYHHGAVPEPIRMYIEKLYTEIKDIEFVITTSTLLEGVNLPADKMFILDNKKGKPNLTASDFKNLIGRICRFSQIFDKENGSLLRLEPEIYLVVGNYFSKNANANTFIQNVMNVEKRQSDDIRNVLLENTSIDEDNKNDLAVAQEFIENYEGDIVKDYSLRKVSTTSGKMCFANHVTEFDIFDNEEKIEDIANKIKDSKKKIKNTQELFNVLYKMFFCRINDDEMTRFEHEETRNFYKMFLDWRISNTSLNQMIASFVRYWKGILQDPSKENLVFVGRWGDVTRNGIIPLWTDISNKSDYQLVNLAVVRIKEEQDFMDNSLMKFIEILNDMELIEESLYLQIKYGTDDKEIIACVRNGISLSLARLIVEDYKDYAYIDVENHNIMFKADIIDVMKQAKENEIMINELFYFCE